MIFKLTNRKKEGNKLLRAIDTENVDTSQFCHDMNTFANILFNNGLDHVARLLIQEASKLHIFLSQYQRPVLAITREGIETELIWDKDQHVGLSTYDEELTELKEFLPKLKEEAMKVAKEIDPDDWYVYNHQDHSTTNFIRGKSGNFSVLPLFTYGKRRRVICVEKMPETCKFIKSNFDRAAKLKFGTVKLSVMDPKIKTVPLDGLTNMRLRILVPLQIPAKFTLTLGRDTVVPVNNDMVVIDDSFEHKYDNEESTEAAIWFSIDIPHPDVTHDEAKGMWVSPYAKNFFMAW